MPLPFSCPQCKLFQWSFFNAVEQFHDKEGEAREQAVAQKGIDDMHNAGKVIDGPQGVTTGGIWEDSAAVRPDTSESAGAQSAAVGSLGSESPTH